MDISKVYLDVKLSWFVIGKNRMRKWQSSVFGLLKFDPQQHNYMELEKGISVYMLENFQMGRKAIRETGPGITYTIFC